MKELTGNIRYRACSGWFRRVRYVIEVEERVTGYSHDHSDPFYSLDREYDFLRYRDATL